MHGREGGEHRKRSRHMWSVPSTKAVAGIDCNGSSDKYFFKDGRKINVGDCALFKPPQDSPPFVGLIRCLALDKESNVRLSVNWLYRPTEVKLLKGVALEAAPNEVFYSFHSDEIPAASLLHPCKVAFLPKGVELPSGVSSFVCRRVYDITNKCWWWLTDQDFIDDRQEEVDQLLHKTRIEMHASLEQQQGAHSPKPVNRSAATSPLKHSPDSIQNSSSNHSSHTKGKKRERGDQSFEAIKRERSVRADDGDSAQLRSESLLNLEIAKITEEGGLMDSEAVARLVRLMQPEKSERKIDLTGRTMLAGIIAATDKLDCLSQFVELGGLPVLDEWLREVHKGKIGDSGNLKDSDKSVEDFLLILLRALDKLPVNLHALQTCNIGKSVNHLRSHKNSEVQKKARSLVDTWKKRVEVEMNINDSKSGSSQAVPWPGRSRHDGSHGGNRHSNGTTEAAIRSSVAHHSSLKSASVKLAQGESTSKSASAYPGGARSTLSPTSNTANCKDGQSKLTANGGISEPPQTVAREEKSSSSSQSYTNSQCSSDQAKNMVPCGKEDARRSTAGSRSLNKATGGGYKHRKSSNGPSGLHREAASNRNSSITRNSAVEKVSHNATDALVPEANNHKIIVKIPNRGRGAAQSVIGGSVEDSSCRNSRASSPAFSEKHDQSDACSRGKHDSNQSNEIDGSSTAVHQRTSDSRRIPNVSKVPCSASRNEMKSRKTRDSSFSSMNALIESCAKFSEANASISAGDDVGMNLLASVAAREISKSGIVSPSVSPQRNSVTAGNSTSNENKKELHGSDVIQHDQSINVADVDNQNIGAEVHDEGTCKEPGTATEDLHQDVEGCLKNNGILDEKAGSASLSVSPTCTIGRTVGDLGEVFKGKCAAVKDEIQNQLPVESQGLSSVEAEDKVKAASLNDESEAKAHRDATLRPPSDDDDKNGNVCQGIQSNVPTEKNMLALASRSASVNTNEKPTEVSSGTVQHSAAANSIEVKFEEADGVDLCNHVSEAVSGRLDQESDPSSIPVKQEESRVCSADIDKDFGCKDETSENKETIVQKSHSSATVVTSAAVALPETELNTSTEASKLTAAEGEIKQNNASATGNVAPSPTSGGSNVDAKLGFDLNEGFNVDEGKNAEPVNLSGDPYPVTVCSVSPLQIPFSSASGGLPASVTVAAAAKGPFVPPDDLLTNKRELGWKGSAATSAFRPAEPRKVMEVPLGLGKAPFPDVSASKQARPPLDIDLNVADESSVQESNFKMNPICELRTTASLRSSGGLDLDLNKVDVAPDMGQHPASNSQRVEVSTPPVKPSTSITFSDGAGSRRDFDLNDGPATEELPVEQASYNQHVHSNIPLQPPFAPRINGSDTGSCFPWYPPGMSYSVSVTPSALPDREAFPIVGIGGGPPRAVAGPTSSLSFNPDAYRGSAFSSSPAMPFHSASFQYPVFPFGTSFSLPASALAGGSSGYMDPSAGGRISAIPSQLVGNAAAVSFQYPHAYVVSRPILDVGNNGVFESNQKRGKQGLDLNSGPGGPDAEGRDESLPTVSRQVSTITSQSLAEEQARMYSMEGSILKRKEPEGGWTMDKLNFKQSSWR